MAFVNEIRGYETNLISRMSTSLRGLAQSYEQRRSYTQTVRELNALDNHTLADLGFGRGDVHDVAFRAVYGR